MTAPADRDFLEYATADLQHPSHGSDVPYILTSALADMVAAPIEALEGADFEPAVPADWPTCSAPKQSAKVIDSTREVESHLSAISAEYKRVVARNVELQISLSRAEYSHRNPANGHVRDSPVSADHSQFHDALRASMLDVMHSQDTKKKSFARNSILKRKSSRKYSTSTDLIDLEEMSTPVQQNPSGSRSSPIAFPPGSEAASPLGKSESSLGSGFQAVDTPDLRLLTKKLTLEMEAARLSELEDEHVCQSSSVRAGGLRFIITFIVESRAFEVFTAFLMISNVALLAVAIDEQSADLNSDLADSLELSMHIYTLFFVIEAVLRFIAAGPRGYVFGPDYHWNFLDVVSAGAGLFESIVAVFEIRSLGRFALLKVVRVLRLLRVLRIVRILRFVRDLRTLLSSILSTLKSLFWAMLLLLLLVFGAALVLTEAATQGRQDFFALEKTVELTNLEEYWGRMAWSMATLFMSISNGVSWEIPYRALVRVNQIWGIVFMGYIIFSYFAVLNVLTAQFCQVATESAASDQEVMIRAIKAKKIAFNQLLHRIFNQIDTNGSGRVSVSELIAHFEEDDMQAMFSSLDLEPHGAWELFKLLDTSGDQFIDADEFVAGCMRLRGHAKEITISGARKEQGILLAKLDTFKAMTEEILFEVKKANPSRSVTGVTDTASQGHPPPVPSL